MKPWKVAALVVGGFVAVPVALFVGSVVVLTGLSLAGVIDLPEPPPEKPSESEPADDEPDNDRQSARQNRSRTKPRPRPKPRPEPDTLRVTRVIDGDTVDTDRLDRVRLIGIDTPEQGRCYENAATRFTRSRIGGKRVRYELGVERRDRYGRTLAYLSLPGGEMHNLELAREGYATALTIPPNSKYAGRFVDAETQAKQRNEGRWGKACERRPRRSKSRPRRRDADGDGRVDDAGGSSSSGSGAPSGDPPSAPPYPPDKDCSDFSGPVAVGPSDPHRLDSNDDGIGCE